MKTSNYRLGNKTIFTFHTKSYGDITGTAKCHPEDSFDMQFGLTLAKTRAERKLYKKIYADADKEYQQKLREYRKAKKNFEKSCRKLTDSWIDFREADRILTDLEVHK